MNEKPSGSLFPEEDGEKIPPATAVEAFEDFVRELGRQQEGGREALKRLLDGLDTSRVVLATTAVSDSVQPPLTGFELMFANKIEWCVKRKLLNNSLEAIGAIEDVLSEVRQGGVFIREEAI